MIGNGPHSARIIIRCGQHHCSGWIEINWIDSRIASDQCSTRFHFAWNTINPLNLIQFDSSLRETYLCPHPTDLLFYRHRQWLPNAQQDSIVPHLLRHRVRPIDLIRIKQKIQSHSKEQRKDEQNVFFTYKFHVNGFWQAVTVESGRFGRARQIT